MPLAGRRTEQEWRRLEEENQYLRSQLAVFKEQLAKLQIVVHDGVGLAQKSIALSTGKGLAMSTVDKTRSLPGDRSHGGT